MCIAISNRLIMMRIAFTMVYVMVPYELVLASVPSSPIIRLQLALSTTCCMYLVAYTLALWGKRTTHGH